MSMPTLDAIRGEIITIYREDPVETLGFCHRDQRSVGEIHRSICVLHHQLERAAQQSIVERPNRQSGLGNEVHQALRADAVGREQVKRFRENGGRCRQGLVN